VITYLQPGLRSHWLGSPNEPREARPRGLVITVDAVDREAIYEELQHARVTFRRLVEEASPDDLARGSSGTRWSNQQLLFHMLFGYLLTRPLIVLAGMFARLPASASQVFAGLLDEVTAPFHWVNYLGSCAGAKVFPRRRMAGKLDQVTTALEQRLRAETRTRLRSGMHYPVRWDPFFKDFMTLADLYHYPTQHFDCHQRQLTLGQSAAETPPSPGPGTDRQSATRCLEGR
jgi:hypothetical protein